MIQIGSITNIFGCCTNGARENPYPVLVGGVLVVGGSVALIPVIVAFTGLLLALASVLVAIGLVIGAIGVTVALPYAARQYRVGAEATRDAVIAHGVQMGVAEHMQRLNYQRPAEQLPTRPVFVTSTVGTTEMKEIA